ncbi:MAG: PAS domain S-box protein [Verrucomicrobiota bacterium]|nr:PAS domain S-box protein [Verrucomicrobiota bacterium]
MSSAIPAGKGFWREHMDLRAGIVIFAILVVGINTLVVLHQGRSEVQAARESTETQNAKIAAAYQQYVERVLAHAEVVAASLQKEYAARGAGIDLPSMQAEGAIDPKIYAAVGIIDERGEVAAWTGPPLERNLLEMLRSEAFRIHSPRDLRKIVVGQPLRTAGSRVALVPLTRRLNKADGGFGGIAVLEVDARYLTDFVDILPREDNMLAVVGTDRILRSRRVGQAISSGDNLQTSPMFAELARHDSGNLVFKSSIDGVRRIFSFRALQNYPLIVTAGVSEERTLAPVLHRKKWMHVRSGILTGIITLLTVVLLRALTRRKRALSELQESEAALRSREEELRTLTETMPQIVWTSVPEGPEFFNQRWTDFTGLSLAASQKNGWTAALHPDDAPKVAESWRHAMEHGELFEMEFRLRRADGAYHWMLGRALPLTDGTGRITKWFGTSTDIDGQMAAQARVREQAELLDLTDDAIIVRDLDDTIRFWNRGAQKLYGWSADEVLGRKTRDFAYEDPPTFLAAKAMLVDRGQWSGEVQHLRRDGESITVLSRWTTVPARDGHAASVLVVNTDLTEQKRFEQQFLRTQRLESIGTLASGVAHDLNNVLSPVLMAAPLLRDEMSAEKRERLVSLIEQSAERGAEIVKQVLTFARDADGQRMLLQPVHLLKDIGKMVEETFPKSITLHLRYPEDVWLLEADSTQLHQLLLNLCVNSRDAMRDGGSLALSAANFDVDENYAATTVGLHAGPYVVLEVADTGSGIPQEIIEKIYDPFFTTKGVGKGTGLGLSTVLGIVRSHGGVLNVQSTAQGTTFRVFLPASTQNAETQTAAASDSLPQGRGEMILIVDDESAVREIAETVLLQNGYGVLLAEDGPAALSIFAARGAEIALVLTDLVMPIMDGLSLARTLRKMDSEIRIVISTGQEDELPTGELSQIGILATLPKPYNQRMLLQLLDGILNPAK